jgi:hypothetical protein
MEISQPRSGWNLQDSNRVLKGRGKIEAFRCPFRTTFHNRSVPATWWLANFLWSLRDHKVSTEHIEGRTPDVVDASRLRSAEFIPRVLR